MNETGSSLREREKKWTGVGGTEGGRSPTGVPPTPVAAADGPPGGASGHSANPEVPESPVRRRFTGKYKQRVLQEADRCTQPGQLGALLRREGLYSSQLSTWRRQRDQGILQGLSKRRGRKAKPNHPLIEQNQRLRQEVEQLKRRLQQAETIIDVQKKLSEMLGIPTNSSQNSEREQ